MTTSGSVAGLFFNPFAPENGPRGAAFLALTAFIVAFLFIRTSARMIRAEVSWWPGNVETTSGLHIHHMVWGILALVIAGFAGFALPSDVIWHQLAAIFFGIGCGLTLDEFALWLTLDDVYWSNEGRVSLDAVVLVVAFMAFVVIGTKPFGLNEPASIAVTAYAVVQALAFSVWAFLKGRIAFGVFAIFIPAFGVWSACRLAKTDSPWAKRFYDDAKLAKAAARFPPDRRTARWRQAFFDAIGGKPSDATAPTPGPRSGAQ